MVLTEVFLNEFARIEVNKEHHFIQITWLQHTSDAAFRETLTVALQYAKENGLYLWLSDMRRLCYVTIADQVWTVKEFIPAFDNRLHHRSACLVSLHNMDLIPDTLIQESLRQDSQLAEKMKLKVFLDMESALYWLLQ